MGVMIRKTRKTYSTDHPESYMACASCGQHIFDGDDYILLTLWGTGGLFPCCSEECSDEQETELSAGKGA